MHQTEFSRGYWRRDASVNGGLLVFAFYLLKCARKQGFCSVHPIHLCLFPAHILPSYWALGFFTLYFIDFLFCTWKLELPLHCTFFNHFLLEKWVRIWILVSLISKKFYCQLKDMEFKLIYAKY